MAWLSPHIQNPQIQSHSPQTWHRRGAKGRTGHLMWAAPPCAQQEQFASTSKPFTMALTGSVGGLIIPI
eukprot:1138089-Pelagomonas_calceolata.AAC.5